MTQESGLTMDAFQSQWLHFHPGTWPLAHVLSDTPGWNMTQFHLMPGHQAIARDHDELRGLLERFNRMGTAALGEGEPCWLILLSSPNENTTHRRRTARLKKTWKMKSGWSFYSDTDALNYTVLTAEVTWRSNAFNRWLLHIYHRRLRDVMWMNRKTGAIYHPYEAGCILSQPTPQQLIDLVSGHYGWLPKNGEGFLKFNAAQTQSMNFKVSKACGDAISRAITPKTA